MIETCFQYWRTVMAVLLFGIIAGVSSYYSIPKEATPEVKIPFVMVTMHLHGVSADDAQSLLVKPVEQKIQSIAGIKEMTSKSYQGGANITVEFQAGMDVNKAYRDVLDKVDEAKAQLPEQADSPIVEEIDISGLPVLQVHLSGSIPQRSLYKIANVISDEIESSIPMVLESKVLGERKEVLEINMDPIVLQSYNITIEQAINAIRRNNALISSGAIETKGGKINIKVPGLIKTAQDLFDTPLLSIGDKIIKFKDVANVRRTFKAPTDIARYYGQQTVTLAVSKRAGKNMLDTVGAIKETVSTMAVHWPNLKISFTQDQSTIVRTMLANLENNIIVSIILVMLVILSSMGLRSSLLVGLAVPASFLFGVWLINLMGFTFNIVVLFGLILSIGMLVDGAIIVVEDADRNMTHGSSPYGAYLQASKRMFVPILTSIFTTLAVFFPLLFWPGFVGEFMKFLPITLLVTLGSSLLVAIIFIPTLGSLVGAVEKDVKASANIKAIETCKFDQTVGMTRHYIDLLRIALQNPVKVILSSIGLMISVIVLYVSFGKGVEFFPNVDPDILMIDVQGKGNLSIYQKDNLIRSVEKTIIDMNDFKSITSSTSVRDGAQDTIGRITLELKEYKNRPRSVSQVMVDLKARTKNAAGVSVQIQKQKNGPPGSKPIIIQIQHHSSHVLDKAAQLVKDKLASIDEVINVNDSKTINGIEWVYTINRSQAQKYGLDIATVGNAIKLATNGIKVDTYLPDDAKDEIDIVVRFSEKFRNLDQINNMHIYTSKHGLVPISNFVTMKMQQQQGTITNVDRMRTRKISADIKEGIYLAAILDPIKKWITDNQHTFPEGLKVSVKGEDKEQKDAAAFLGKAFIVAMVVIAIILMTQFNSVFSMMLVLSSVIISTIGMLLGLLVMGLAFSVVMCGIGMIALSGIIVSNNILIIDTYERLKYKIKDPLTLLLSTGAHRLRAILLTQLTTSLGLLPIVLKISINFTDGTISYGDPSVQWWIQLATCIVFGVIFASPLTLFVTPCAIMIKDKWFRRKDKK